MEKMNYFNQSLRVAKITPSIDRKTVCVKILVVSKQFLSNIPEKTKTWFWKKLFTACPTANSSSDVAEYTYYSSPAYIDTTKPYVKNN